MANENAIYLRSHVMGHAYGAPKAIPPQKAFGEAFAQHKSALGEAAADQKFGEGAVVAILDTGYTAHRWFQESRRVPSPAEADCDRWDLSSDSLPTYYAHGTFVAGRVLQYAPRATIDLRRVTAMDGMSHDWVLAAAIMNLIPKDVPGEYGPDVLNLSLGPGEHGGDNKREATPQTTNAIRALQQACGTVVVVSAGYTDDGWPQANLGAQGNVVEDLTIIVGASDDDHKVQDFSAEIVDIFAPGKEVKSTFIYWYGMTTAEPSGGTCDDCIRRLPPGPVEAQEYLGWASWSGTSFAAPAVAGAVASAVSRRTGTADIGARRRAARKDVVDDATEKDGRRFLNARPIPLS
ncbi:MAG: S8 family serine peptidase [Catenulispora sp.]